MRLILAALGVGTTIAVLAAACSTTTPVIGSSATDGVGGPGLDGTWVLTSGNQDGDALPMPDGATIDMTLDGDVAGGTAACNSWFGEVVVGDGTLSFSQLGQTEMGCRDDRMRAEAAYLTALGAVESFEVDGNNLRLNGPDVELAFARKPPVSDAELITTSWTLDTVFEDDAAASTFGDAHLVFKPDGSLDGSTGCRTFSGTWATDAGGQLVISDVASDGPGCSAELTRQDQNVLETLFGRVTAEVDGTRLTITGPSGTGLGYTAS